MPEPGTAAIRTPIAVRPSSAVVWGVWAVMLLAALVAIARYGPEIPRAEDWFLVPPLTGNEPRMLGWLWEQNSEHRLPLPRLAYLALLKLTGGDFRAGMVFNTLAMAALAGAMIVAARRLRGRSSYADAFFPVALLHLGHWDNLVWSWQIQFVLSTLCAGVVVLVVAMRGADLTPPQAVLAGVCIVALPLCGANGLVLVPALAAWLAYAALRASAAGSGVRARTTALILLTSAAAALVLTGVYFLGYERASWYPVTPSAGATLKIAAQLLAMAFGPGAAVSWPGSVLVTLALVAVTSALLLRRLHGASAGERTRILGLLCILVAMAMLALAMGWGRAGRIATGGLSRRYALLAVPLLCAIFLAWELYAPRRWAGRVQAALLVLVVALLPGNTVRGLGARDWVEAGMSAVRRDIATGMPTPLLAERHRPFLLHWDGDRLAAGMRMLGAAGLRPFAGLPEEFEVAEVDVRAAVTASGADLVVALGAPRRVYAIRLPTLQPSAGATIRIAWQGSERGPGMEVLPSQRPGDPAGPSTTAWINDVIGSIRVHSDDPVALRTLRIVLLTPKS